MKKKFTTIVSALSLAALFGLCACTDGGVTPNPDEGGTGGNGGDATTYTVTFTDRGNTVETFTKKKGEKITVPEAPDYGDERYLFAGWEGLSAEATEITVYGDATYDANWTEMFGSSKVFTAMERSTAKAVTVDGDGSDEAWADATAYALDENGSTVKFLWDESGVYLFADVKKADAGEEDKLSVLIDLLHSDKLASETWDGKGWGGVYRGEPGPMVEGGYTIKAGANDDNDVEKTWEWLSNSGTGREVRSVIGESGYTVEFKIGTTNSEIGEYKPHAGQGIGLSVETVDGAAKLERFNGYADHGPKSLSNVLLAKNSSNVDFLWSVKEVRENYDIVVDGVEDRLLYARDAGVFNVGEDGTTVKALWNKSGKIYFLVDLGEQTTSLKIEAFGGEVTFTEDGEQALVAAGGYAGALATDDWGELKLTVNNEVTESYIRLVRNESNIGRHLFEAKQLADGASITVDGDRDEAYGEKVADITTISLRENGSAPQSTGVAYIRWDDSYLYVFVEVTDSDVSTSQIGDAHQNDSVEVWLSTCQSLPTPSIKWGDNNRPLGLYRGEGNFRVLAGKVGADSGQHWLWDDDRTRAETASKVTETGYTVEYKIPWAHRFDEFDDGFGNYIPSTGVNTFDSGEPSAKLNEIIDIMININDDNGKDGVREGITSLNGKGCDAWDNPYVLDQLKLVAAG